MHSTKTNDTINSTINAIQYCKELPTCKEARSFFDDYVPKIVRILLEKLEYGETEVHVKPRIKTVLEGALEIVSSDLKEAAESKCCCKTWTILVDIFDEVTGYQESVSDTFDLVGNTFRSEGFENLRKYLSNHIAAPSFPKFDEVSTILNMMEVAVKGSNKKYYRLCSYTVRVFVLHLLSFEEEQLIRLGDDSIDICRRLQNIIRRRAYPKQKEFFDLLRDFVFKLTSSSEASLKVLGYHEMQKIAETSARAFPPPRAYLVQGAGDDNFNGIYEFDSNGLTHGFVNGDATIRYVKNVKDPSSGTEGAEKTSECHEKSMKIFHSPQQKRWCIKNGKKLFYIHPCSTCRMPPHSGWIQNYHSAGTAPTLSPIGLMVPDGEEFCTLEHDFWYWIVKYRVLEVTAQDSKSIVSEVQQEATKAGHSLLHFIGQMLHRCIDTVPEPSELDAESIFYENIKIVMTQVMQHLLLLNGEGFKGIIPDFMMQTCDQMRVITEHISTSGTEDLMVDYLVFRRLLLLRLKVSSGLSMAEIEDIPGAKLSWSPPQNYYIVGAGCIGANGRYTLKKRGPSNSARFVTYTKCGRDADTLYIIQQCLFGPDIGKWFISLGNDNDLNVQEDKKYYVNTSMTATPPGEGWIEVEDGVSPGPTLTTTAVEVNSIESEQQGRYDLLDVSTLDMTDQQSKLWKVVQELSDFVELSESDRTEVAKETMKQSLALFEGSTAAKCAEIILDKIDIQPPANLLQD